MKNRTSARALTAKEQRLRDDERGLRWIPCGRNIRQAEFRERVFDVRRRVAVRNLPGDFAFVHVVRRDATVRRLEKRQVFDIRHLTASARGVRGFGRIRRIGFDDAGDERTRDRSYIDETCF